MARSPQPMTTEEYLLLDELISERFGISFPEPKRELLASRLAPRLAELHLARFLDYYLLLQGAGDDELEALVALVTNNESYFFRETHQFEALFDGPRSLAGELARGGRLRVLCAGCSSGEEPYTLNIFARASLAHASGVGVDVDAFDLDAGRLAVARAACYPASSLRAASEEQRGRYFLADDGSRYRLRETLREGVRLRHGNLLEADAYPGPGAYDVIFCRNVLIYFSEAALHRAVERFAGALRPGGILFLGHSESIIGKSDRFASVRIGRSIAYRRVA